MAKRLMPRNGNGVPSANQKIVEGPAKQGFKGLGKMQGTTRVIYDSVLLATTTTNTTMRLFEGAKTRQFPLTNLSENKLQVGEALAMQRFSIFILGCATGTTNVTTVVPLNYFTVYQRFYGAQMSFSIGQDQVIKKLPLTSMYAPFNRSSKFMGYYTVQALAADPVTGYTYPQDIYEFDSDIVIPPTIEFYADITLPPLTPQTGFDSYLCMKIEGLGSLYSPKGNY